MRNKLLLVTAGTVAAGVGKAFLRQMHTHAVTDLDVKVCYIDTDWLPSTYGDLQVGEWQHLHIDSRGMNNIRAHIDQHPRMKRLLYPNLLPETDGTGGGRIRYNAAGALEFNRDIVKKWLRSNINDLASTGERQISIPIVFVVSAVGATGSGTLERLIDVAVEAAHDAGVPTPIRCDVFILQPGTSSTDDLMLANTFSLYAEMAASRLSPTPISGKLYQGRTMMVGWGGTLASLEELEQSAATLIRISKDTISGVASRHMGGQVDIHVLREIDAKTGLPSHLSTATPLTITLGSLSQQILQADVARLLNNLIFGNMTNSTNAQQDVDHVNLLFGPLNFLSASDPTQQYKALLQRIAEGVGLNSFTVTPLQLGKMPAREQAATLRRLWLADRDELRAQGTPKIQREGRDLATTIIKQLEAIRNDNMGKNYTLTQLLDDYQQLSAFLNSLLRAANQFVPQPAADDNLINQRLAELEANRRGPTLNNAIGAIQGTLFSQLERSAHTVATQIIQGLDKHCSATLLALRAVQQRARQEKAANPRWGTMQPVLIIDIDHPLHIPALSNQQNEREIQRYYEQVSLFSAQGEDDLQSFLDNIVSSNNTLDPLSDFRQWLIREKLVELLFKGDFDRLVETARRYVELHMTDRLQKRSVLDVLLQIGGNALYDRLLTAASRARPLVSFSESFAESRKESLYISAMYTENQRTQLETTIRQAFGQGERKIIKSNDPTEIVVFYCIDGIPMSAVNDLSGRCLESFLKLRKLWHMRKRQGQSQRVGVPIYSGQDAESLVRNAGIIHQLYHIKGENVGEYTVDDIPELAPAPLEDVGSNGHNGNTNGQYPKDPNSQPDSVQINS